MLNTVIVVNVTSRKFKMIIKLLKIIYIVVYKNVCPKMRTEYLLSQIKYFILKNLSMYYDDCKSYKI